MTEKPLSDRRREVATLIRQSSVLDPTLKRHWIGVLPYLKAADLERLTSILAGDLTADDMDSLAKGLGERQK